MIQFLFRQFVHLIGNLTELLELAYRFLFRWQPEPGAPRSLARTVLTFPLRLVGGVIAFGGWLVMFPFHAATTFRDERSRDFLCGVPAVMMVIFAAIVLIYTFLKRDAVDNVYRGQALNSIRDKDYERAKVFLGRIINQDGAVSYTHLTLPTKA